jgi:hypothetical protein
MRNIDKTAEAIARAIKACNGQRITADAAKAEMATLLKDSDPQEAVDNASVFMNISALNQELERHAYVTTERSKSALMSAVGKALAS